MHSWPQLGTDLSGQLFSTAITLLYPSVCKAARYIFERNNNSQRKSCPICPVPVQLSDKWCMAYNFLIAADRSASSPSDCAVTRIDLLCHCLKATVSSEAIITLTVHFNIIHLPYNKLLLQSALQPLVGFRPAQQSLSILSRKVLQSAVVSGTSNPQLGGEPGI
jgi:hypothetical protein